MVKLKQFDNLSAIDDDVTSENYGTYIENRGISELLNYGLIILDKPNGPTSHETSAWVKKMLGVNKIGHSGTLDPQVSGVLPLGVGEGTKALGVLLAGPKEYYTVGRLHSEVPREKLEKIIEQFQGNVFQKPPLRSSVSRKTRIRRIFELNVVEHRGQLLLIRVLCESGTYVRKIIYDIGEIIGGGATMTELRRSRVSQFEESIAVKMHDLLDAYTSWKESGKEEKLKQMLLPIESALTELKTVIIRDSAVDALCHGAQLAIPGILQISYGVSTGESVGVYTKKREVVALAEAVLDYDDIKERNKGVAFKTKRIIMSPGTYPKSWHSKGTTTTTQDNDSA